MITKFADYVTDLYNVKDPKASMKFRPHNRSNAVSNNLNKPKTYDRKSLEDLSKFARSLNS